MHPGAWMVPERIDQPTPCKAPEDWTHSKTAGGPILRCGVLTLIPAGYNL